MRRTEQPLLGNDHRAALKVALSVEGHLPGPGAEGGGVAADDASPQFATDRANAALKLPTGDGGHLAVGAGRLLFEEGAPAEEVIFWG